MRKRLSYANVAATLALVFSMTGGAMAANHYLISSTKQIKPSILKKLKGNTGKTGKTGAAGGPGTPGAQGKEGPQGKEGAAGSAVAFAHILGKTTPASPLDTTTSKNVSAVTQPFPGGYCVATTVPITNVSGGAGDFNSGASAGLEVTGNFSLVAETIKTKVCPAGTTVLLESAKGATTEGEDFWVSFN